MKDRFPPTIRRWSTGMSFNWRTIPLPILFLFGWSQCEVLWGTAPISVSLILRHKHISVSWSEPTKRYINKTRYIKLLGNPLTHHCVFFFVMPYHTSPKSVTWFICCDIRSSNHTTYNHIRQRKNTDNSDKFIYLYLYTSVHLEILLLKKLGCDEIPEFLLKRVIPLVISLIIYLMNLILKKTKNVFIFIIETNKINYC